MKLYIVVEEKNGNIVWTDERTYDNKENAVYAKSTYQKFYKKNANLKIITLDMTKIKPKTNTDNSNKAA